MTAARLGDLLPAARLGRYLNLVGLSRSLRLAGRAEAPWEAIMSVSPERARTIDVSTRLRRRPPCRVEPTLHIGVEGGGEDQHQDDPEPAVDGCLPVQPLSCLDPLKRRHRSPDGRH